MNRYRVKFKIIVGDLEGFGSLELSNENFEAAVEAFKLANPNADILEVSSL